MNSSVESFVKDILVDYSDDLGNWTFSEFLDKNGNTLPQSKKYSGDNRWCAYPDYEYFNQNKLVMLVELKCQNGYFDGIQYALAMRKRHFDSYVQVRMNENVDLRICFVVWLNDDINIFWETIENMFKMESREVRNITKSRRNRFGLKEEITEDYVFWDVREFREDYWNLPII